MGPLAGLRVVELAGIGPVPFAAMLLADLGADVVRVDRPSPFPVDPAAPRDPVLRGRRSVAVDLKAEAGRDVVLDLAGWADVLLEGFRPGVMERLGLGPDACHLRNPALVYGRMTGWGQDGPRASQAGHDIDYIALTGALHATGRADEQPVPPLNLVGDLGGGALYLVVGALAGVLHARTTGQGQVVDAAIVDGTVSLAHFIRGLQHLGMWGAPRGRNLLDTGAPFYEVYACADGLPLAVGALEPQFYDELVRRSGIEVTPEVSPERRLDPRTWPEAKRQWAALFATRPRAEWLDLLDHTDACVAPVLDWDESLRDEHLAARGTYVEHDGFLQASPAPRFDVTPAALDRPAPWPGQHTDEVLALLGRDAVAVSALRSAGAVA
ncbi:MAG: CaiB/BaiF CoA-transferase family protein [Candidatus Nanopelagicales bacterium]